ncbi:methyltransferase domain-containing protein [Halosegnis longus]|uniref:Methyltransferase domain-containing protein n=1 Tax=Halosegnis longus TaxID=2216012 RepID=A0AAJ4R9B9_9EURY|nr:MULTISPECIES: methyltransferase domain-containing protein [Halobacteriales]RNJ26689.1 methyltransferase domain-containing protein [Salella cibi]
MSYLFVRENRELLLAPGDRHESDLGVLEVPADVQPGDTVETHIGEAFEVREPRGPDLFDHLDRTGAPMMPRDIGLILGEFGLGDGDRVLDAGTGTGILSVYLARHGIEVVTYERDPDFADVARENMATAGVADRVDVRTGDVTDDLDSLSGFDGLTLDTGDAASVVAQAPDLLVPGGPVAVYSPFIESSRDCVETAREVGLVGVETVETIQREMTFDDRGSRPSTRGVGHTGYLTFARTPI